MCITGESAMEVQEGGVRHVFLEGWTDFLEVEGRGVVKFPSGKVASRGVVDAEWADMNARWWQRLKRASSSSHALG